MLDRLVDEVKGDIAVDIAGQRPPYHPHHTAPYLKQLLLEAGHDIAAMTTVTVTRNPIDMLWSYYKFFRPDRASRYTFSPGYDPADRMGFEEWVNAGRIGMHPVALRLAPAWISTADLSPLSLEAHAETRDGRQEIDRVFQLEDIAAFSRWLGEQTGQPHAIVHVNASDDNGMPPIGTETRLRIRRMFPAEATLYGI